MTKVLQKQPVTGEGVQIMLILYPNQKYHLVNIIFCKKVSALGCDIIFFTPTIIWLEICTTAVDPQHFKVKDTE